MENQSKRLKTHLELFKKQYNNKDYHFVVIFVILLLSFMVSGSTSSNKNFANFREDFIISNSWLNRFYKNYSNNKIQFNQTVPAYSIEIINQKKYFDINGQLLDTNSIGQDLKTSFNPIIIDRESILKQQLDSPLTELIPPPNNPIKKNFLEFPVFNIVAPIVYSDEVSSQDIIDPNNPCSSYSKNTPLQQLVQKGLVHLWPSPKPGELFNIDKNSYYDKTANAKYYIGNTYIVGHSSECIQHEYSKVLAPIQDKMPIGEYIIIYDELGRKLNFRIFEAKEITSQGDGAAEAFKIFEGRRVITLQTSKFYSNSKINRWIIRGELEIRPLS
jgi:hypothetical protein